MWKKAAAVVLGLLTFFCCYPVVFIITGVFMGDQELQKNLAVVLQGGNGYAHWSILPWTPTLKNIIEILLDTPQFFVMFWNSVKTTGGVLFGQILIAAPAAWGLSKYRFPMRRLLFFLYIILMMMPFQVTMLSSYLVLKELNILNTLWALILPGIFSTFSVFIMHNAFCAVPDALLEAARIDGAGEWRIFVSIGMPVGLPGVISAGVLAFLEYWNLVEQPMTFLEDQSLWPLSLFLPQIGAENVGMAFAASVLTLIPSMIVFFAGAEYLESGISSLGLKE